MNRHIFFVLLFTLPLIAAEQQVESKKAAHQAAVDRDDKTLKVLECIAALPEDVSRNIEEMLIGDPQKIRFIAAHGLKLLPAVINGNIGQYEGPATTSNQVFILDSLFSALDQVHMVHNLPPYRSTNNVLHYKKGYDWPTVSSDTPIKKDSFALYLNEQGNFIVRFHPQHLEQLHGCSMQQLEYIVDLWNKRKAFGEENRKLLDEQITLRQALVAWQLSNRIQRTPEQIALHQAIEQENSTITQNLASHYVLE